MASPAVRCMTSHRIRINAARMCTQVSWQNAYPRTSPFSAANHFPLPDSKICLTLCPHHRHSPRLCWAAPKRRSQETRWLPAARDENRDIYALNNSNSSFPYAKRLHRSLFPEHRSILQLSVNFLLTTLSSLAPLSLFRRWMTLLRFNSQFLHYCFSL